MAIDPGQARRAAARLWHYVRVPCWLAVAVLAAFVAAYAVSKLTGPVYQFIIGAYRWLDGMPLDAQSGAQVALSRGKLFADLALGVTVVVAWFKDVTEKVGGLWPWPNATGHEVRTAWLAVFASCVGLFISAFALERSTSSSTELSLTVDGVSIPPVGLTPQDGLVSFYVPFYTEGSYGALGLDADPSVQVPGEFKDFLKALGAILNRCATRDMPVTVTVRGFASVTKWYNVESDTDPANRAPNIKAHLEQQYFNYSKKHLLDREMDEAFNRFLRSRDELARIAKAEARFDSSDNWPNAFNLWLAHSRREAVVREMGLTSDSNSAVTLNRPDWPSYTDMSTNIAVDDAASIRRGSRGGLMSRSVRVTIEEAGTCQKTLLANSTRLQTFD